MTDPWGAIDPGFLEPIWLLIGLCAVGAVALLELGSRRRRIQAITQFAAPSMLAELTGSVSWGRRRLKALLLLAAFALLFIAMARPHLFYQWTEENRTGLDLLLAVDCSKSMLSTDVKPSRLERAKLAVEDFADHLPNNRLGLVAFAGDAFLECPLTLDHQAFLTAVEELDTNTIPRPGTDIAEAIDQAVQALRSQPNNLKFLILVTDGEDLEGRAISAARNAAQQGLKVYTVGVGTAEGAMIPELDNSGSAFAYHQDANGDTVHSRLDEDTLKKIAQLTGGAYQPLGSHGEGLETIYDRYIAALPRQHLEERREKIRFEQFEFPLSLAAFFLVVEFLLRDRRKPTRSFKTPPPAQAVGRARRSAPPASVATVLVLVTLLLLSAEEASQAASVDNAERDYKAGRYGDAAQKYGEALQAQPERRDLQFDRGDAAYKAGGYTEAEDAFHKALETQDLGLQEQSYYNLGNTQFAHGEAMQKVDSDRTRELWEQAVHSYESALKLKEAKDTRHNYEVVKRKLEQLKQQQQQQKQNQQDKGNSKDDKNQGQSGQNKDESGKGKGDQSQNSPNGNQLDPQSGDQPKPDKDGQSKSQEKNGTAQDRARSGVRPQDRSDPGVKNREEAEALLDSLKDDEHRVSARSLNAGNEPPPTSSGKDW